MLSRRGRRRLRGHDLDRDVGSHRFHIDDAQRIGAHRGSLQLGQRRIPRPAPRQDEDLARGIRCTCRLSEQRASERSGVGCALHVVDPLHVNPLARRFRGRRQRSGRPRYLRSPQSQRLRDRGGRSRARRTAHDDRSAARPAGALERITYPRDERVASQNLRHAGPLGLADTVARRRSARTGSLALVANCHSSLFDALLCPSHSLDEAADPMRAVAPASTSTRARQGTVYGNMLSP